MIGTYCGLIDDTNYLNDSNKIISTFYDEVYLKGRKQEEKFDKEGVVRDYNSKGNYVSRDFEIKKENCQWEKNLSCSNQRQARLQMMESSKQQQIDKQTTMYQTKSKKYDLNDECVKRVCNVFYAEAQLQ